MRHTLSIYFCRRDFFAGSENDDTVCLLVFKTAILLPDSSMLFEAVAR